MAKDGAGGSTGRAPPAPLPEGCAALLAEIRARVRAAQVRAAARVNRELVRLYWEIGRVIVERQEREAWGAGVIERLARDLQAAFPGVRGFSSRNIWRMRAFYVAYTKEVTILPQAAAELDGQNMPQAAAEIPWFHNVVLLEKIKDPVQRLWYARQTVEHGWSRNVLVHQIESDLYARQGGALTNFDRTLPAPQSELAGQLLKDPYTLDFLTLSADARERELHRGLVGHIRDFMLELGVGFAFVGSQYHLEVGGRDFYLDLLFYHLRLRAFVVVDLKVAEFEPEFAGKMSFYLSAVDDLLRHAADHPSIGIVLCKSRNRVIVEYALRVTTKPIGVA